MFWWDSQLVPCVLLLSEVTKNVSGILPSAWLEFITTHFAGSRKTLTAESATTMGKCKFNKCWLEQPEFSWLKSKPHNESEAQCILCQRILSLSTLGVKAPVSHTKSDKHQLASKRLQRSHTITHFCTPLSAVPIQASFKPSSAQLWRWKRRCFGFWMLLLNILATDLDVKSWLFFKVILGSLHLV